MKFIFHLFIVFALVGAMLAVSDEEYIANEMKEFLDNNGPGIIVRNVCLPIYQQTKDRSLYEKCKLDAHDEGKFIPV